MRFIKLYVTLIRYIYNNFRHSKVLHKRMVFNWQKIAFYLGENTGKLLLLGSETKKDKKIKSSKIWKQ